MMICSAPSRLAAITPHRPTAPSPTTATALAGADLRRSRPRGGRSPSRPRASTATASAPRPRRREGTSVPSASARAGLAPARRRRPKHEEPAVQASGLQAFAAEAQVPSEYTNGMTTRSPGFTLRRRAPTSSMTPMARDPCAPARVGPHRLVRPQFAAADGSAGDADDRVGRLEKDARQERSRRGHLRPRT